MSRAKTYAPFAAMGLGFMLLLGLGAALFGDEFPIVLRWWLALLAVGVCFLPLTFCVFHRFRDGGWVFSKTIGLLVSGYLSWLLLSVGAARFTRLNTALTLLLCAAVGVCGLLVYLRSCRRGKIEPPKITLDTARAAMLAELVFLALLLFWVYVRSFRPAADGTEKFMDFGLIAAALRSDSMPPNDFWLSGSTVNYYYFGQYLAAWLARLSDIGAEYAYNLMMMTLAALGFSLPFSIVSELTRDIPGRGRGVRSALSGVFAGLLVDFSGNGQYLVYRLFGPLFGNEPDDWWFSNPTRFIGYFPETEDKTIEEFPSYSFILGDLHAHVINLVFVLTLLGIMLCWVRRVRERGKTGLLRELFCPEILLLGFFLGCFWMTNGWDLAIYLVTAGAIVFFNNFVICRGRPRYLLVTAAQGALCVGLALLVSLPFSLSFEKIAGGIGFVETRSPLWQLLVLWGIPVFMLVAFIAVLVHDRPDRDTPCTVYRWVSGMHSSDLFVLVLGLCAAGLVLLPELVYVQDIYSGSYLRSNTMFKLTYQAFTLLALFMAYAVVRMLTGRPAAAEAPVPAADTLPENAVGVLPSAEETPSADAPVSSSEAPRGRHCFPFRRIPAGICGLLLVCTCLYGAAAIGQWYGDILRPEQSETLDATAFWDETVPSVAACIDWLNENVEGEAVIAEADGLSYTRYNGISAFTGLSSVLGWHTHEWLWRSGGETSYPAELTEREDDLSQLYTSGDTELILDVCRKYNISYICVTPYEREKYPELQEDALREAGAAVYTFGTAYIVQMSVG